MIRCSRNMHMSRIWPFGRISPHSALDAPSRAPAGVPRHAVASAAVAALAGAALLLSSAAHADTGKNRIHAVEHGRAGKAAAGATVVRIRGSERPTFAVYTLQGPSRVVVDVAGAVLDDRLTTAGGSMANWPVSGWAVSQVSAYELQGQDDGASRKSDRGLVRIVVDMARPGTYHAKADGRDVVVTVIPRDPEPAGASPAEAARAAEAVREAETRRREVVAAIEDAEERRARAEALRVQAEERRAAVEKELHQAEQKRARAEAAAAEAARRAEQARALREREEAAYRDASTAREETERRTADAARAGKRLAELEAEAKDAKKQVASLRRAADQAARKAAGIEERKSASEREVARARAEAERLAKARAEAESELERRRREVARQASEAERLAKARAAAESELKALDGAAAKARQEREAEEARIAKLTKQRQELEREVAHIRERVRTEARAERAAQRTEAEAELKALDEAADKSRRVREAEEARIAALGKRRQALERELAQARSKAEAERAARRSKAETELESLDGAAEKSRRAREAEEARIAALGKRRQALERDLRRMREQARTAAKDGRETGRLAKARAEAEAELKALDDAADESRRARKQEEARIAALGKRRQALERELAQTRSKAEAERAARRSKAEAELKSLDDAAEKVRRARKQEEARIAELAERRQELERDLARMRKQARTAASTEAAARGRAEAAQQAEAKAAAKAKARSVAVQDVDFVDRGEVARVIIDLASDARTRVVSSKGKRAILEIDGVALPAKLQRTLDIRPYRGPIEAISSYHHPKDRSRMRVVVDLAYPVKSALERDGSTYYWDFAKPAAAGPARATAARNTPGKRSRARAQSYPAPVVGGYGASSTPITQKTVAQLANQGRKVYRGTKIDLDLKDVDIHNVMRLLADVGGINIVVPDDVKAQVTVRLRQVPWDQALEVVLASKGLWYRREGNLYRIAPRKQLDAEDQAEAERLAALVKAEAPEPQIFTLNYAVADDIKSQLEPLLSPKGRIEVDERTNSLIINDVRAHRQRMVDLLTRLDTQTPQIQIEARIVEARSTFARELGVQWGGRFTDSDGLVVPGGVAGGAVDGQTNPTGVLAATPDFAVNLPAAVGSGSGGALGLTLGSLVGGAALTLRLSALEDSGSVRIISAPKITVLNNVRAEISQGVSIPISVISAQGVQTQFVPADLTLKVTPHVSQRDCSIAMELEVAKNEADFVNTGARGDPTILRKEARTTVLVADNETSVLGGIYTRNSGLSYSKVPLLGDLPILGWLFKNRRENDERTEVLLFVTPRITNKAFLRCE